MIDTLGTEISKESYDYYLTKAPPLLRKVPVFYRYLLLTKKRDIHRCRCITGQDLINIRKAYVTTRDAPYKKYWYYIKLF